MLKYKQVCFIFLFLSFPFFSWSLLQLLAVDLNCHFVKICFDDFLIWGSSRQEIEIMLFLSKAKIKIKNKNNCIIIEKNTCQCHQLCTGQMFNHHHRVPLTWLKFLIDKAVITLLQLYTHSALAQSIFSTILGITFVLKTTMRRKKKASLIRTHQKSVPWTEENKVPDKSKKACL